MAKKRNAQGRFVKVEEPGPTDGGGNIYSQVSDVTGYLDAQKKKQEAPPTQAEAEEVPTNGHKTVPEGSEMVTVIPPDPPSPYRYRALKIEPIPKEYRNMTPKWLYKKLHWEEQAKIARVKGSPLGEKVKIGMAAVVLCLFGIVILMLGAIITGG